ncbi:MULTISPECIES: nitroreductase family protein [Cellulophaga]|uniref:Nitroreductase n=1 Tax=Cellulophaga lytica (strain ATCC 23178 / DSM 7489 / JCM 8516 / NBRC 14961 / NCIMB 1423 / VKM B-1433 / Cy l20) TaxID=867900 RepID=F0RDB4_CELLC|nr:MULTISPECIES: nitroreductase family protein [Cellulophaga]ADY30856.1 nitroreductase [Cellulophaga lytica DSM 7489]AIM61834.1 nitroreductase [Cellulophaga lytica]TVZ09810.1 nitroreductase [Cellulophaga sp. RHA_52]WQG78223.1 nitroreductase family protein [Cellulophaga lytica]SNQ42822.1 6,7-dihydropteridine reductase [Cellulophaga lytica]
MEIIKKLEWRYAVKKFNENIVLPDAKIEAIKEAFNLTATSYGLQPIKMVVVKNKALQQQLAVSSYNQQQVAQASHVLVLCRETTINADYIANYFKRVQQVRGTSNDILDPFKQQLIGSFSKKTSDEVAQWATNQAYLILGNLLTVCAATEIDACPMEGFIPAEYDKLLGLQKLNLASVLTMPIGIRADDDVFATFKKVRKETVESVIEIA